MQLLDPQDPRPQYVQIAASIRAAILNGELKPGERLPTGEELASRFGVTRVTVGNAIRTLRDEGFVTSRTGSGTYVRDRGRQPVPTGETHPQTGTAAFLFEAGYLKYIARAGWLRLGMRLPETVAEHSFRTGIVGIALAAAEGADVGRTAALCLMHDAHETRIGDVPAVARAYVTSVAPEAISTDQTSAMPHDVAKAFQDLTAEYEAAETIESRLAHDADKIETLLQAIEYQSQGYDTEAWRDTSITALRTDAARELARAIGAADPHAWWSAFAASYHELRASAQSRARNQRGT